MPIKYIPYLPETIEGQAILNNFFRTRRVLKHNGSEKATERIRRGMPLYEVEILEEVKPENSISRNDQTSPTDEAGKNLLIRGECLSACAYLKDQGTKIDLVYIDPPFASGADYAKKIYLRRNPHLTQQLAAAEEQLTLDEMQAFEEKMYGDIWNKEDYLNWMYENLQAIKSVMSETASIYVHLDWHIGHYVKILLDEVFGEDNFRNEIVWKRSTAHSDSSGFANLHDTIFYYSLSEDFYFDIQFETYRDDYVKTYYRHKDKKGVFLDRDLSAKGLKGRGYYYAWKGKDGYWRCPIETMERYEKEDRLYYTENKTPRYKQYMEEMPGTPVQDLWTNIYAVNSQAQERVEYATQKPEALLERIINASSDKGMTVADFFGGSGVTAAVAHRLGRRFVHADVGLNSIQTARDRLRAAGAAFAVREVKDGVSLFRNPQQTNDKLQTLIPGFARNTATLDRAFWAGSLQDSKLGMIPVYLPDLKDHTQKVLDVPRLNKMLNEALPPLMDMGVKKAVVYYVDMEDEKEITAFIKDYNLTEVELELRDLKEVLDEVTLNDEAEYETSPDGLTLTISRFHSDRLAQKINEYNQRKGVQPKKEAATLFDDDLDAATRPKHAFKPIQFSDSGLELIEYMSLDCTAPEGIWHSDEEIKIDKKGFVIRNGKKTKAFWDGKITGKKTPLRLKIRNIAGDESVWMLEK